MSLSCCRPRSPSLNCYLRDTVTEIPILPAPNVAFDWRIIFSATKTTFQWICFLRSYSIQAHSMYTVSMYWFNDFESMWRILANSQLVISRTCHQQQKSVVPQNDLSLGWCRCRVVVVDVLSKYSILRVAETHKYWDTFIISLGRYSATEEALRLFLTQRYECIHQFTNTLTMLLSEYKWWDQSLRAWNLVSPPKPATVALGELPYLPPSLNFSDCRYYPVKSGLSLTLSTTWNHIPKTGSYLLQIVLVTFWLTRWR